MVLDVVFLVAGLGLGFGVLLVVGMTVVVLNERERARERRCDGAGAFGPSAVRALLLAAPLRPGHPWSTRDESPGTPADDGVAGAAPEPALPAPGAAESTAESADPTAGAEAADGPVERPFHQGESAGSRPEPAGSWPEPVGAAATTPTPSPATDPCADTRTTLTAASAEASRLRTLADAASERLTAAQRAYDEYEGRRDAAAAAADPRAVRMAKDLAQARFHRALDAARDRAARDHAASAWLLDVNEINTRSRDAAAVLARETGQALDLLRALQRAGHEADSARLTALRAADTRHAARIALAACEERERVGTSGGDRPIPRSDGDRRKGALRTIGRLLQGDHATMVALVDALAGRDPHERDRWTLLLSDFVDAVAACAIDATCLVFPERHVLWGALPPASRRDVAVALASLGFRFDGLGGFADGRVPSQRELSFAVGQVGLEQTRIRPWPAEADLPLLFRDVRVDAPAFVAAEAGGLTLGEMVELLGRRAEPLAELWNMWGRIRPLLADD